MKDEKKNEPEPQGGKKGEEGEKGGRGHGTFLAKSSSVGFSFTTSSKRFFSNLSRASLFF